MSDTLDDLGLEEYWGGGEEEEDEYFGDEEEEEEEYIPDEWMEEYDEASSKQKARARARARRRKTAAQRQLRMARRQRQRQRQRPTRRPRTAKQANKAVIKKTRQDLREVALENQVRDDAIGGALGSQGRRIGGLENGAVATPAVRIFQDQLETAFLPGDQNKQARDIVNAAAEYAPTLFLKAGRKQLIGLGAGIGVFVLAEVVKKLREDDAGGGGGNIITDRSPTVPEGQRLKLNTNRNGGVQWKSDNEDVATVDSTGVVTGVKYGDTTIEARLGTQVDVVPLKVTKAGTSSSAK